MDFIIGSKNDFETLVVSMQFITGSICTLYLGSSHNPDHYSNLWYGYLATLPLLIIIVFASFCLQIYDKATKQMKI